MTNLAILCVDDEKSILDSLEMELEIALGNQYLIEMAQNGEEALEVISDLMADSYEVALVIADYIMPGLKGDDLLIRIQEMSPKTIKIMLTGQADLKAIGRAINQANLYRYLTKPWQSEDLILTVTEAIYRYTQQQRLETVNREQANLIAQLHESENRLKQFLEAVPVGIFVTDASGQPYYVNQMGQQIIGQGIISQNLSQEQIEFYQIYVANSDRVYPLEKTPVWNALQGKSIIVDDMEIHHPDRIIPVEVRGTPIYDRDGRIIYTIVAFQDITERKKAQQLLTDYNRILEAQIAERTEDLRIAKEAAEAANRAKSTFLANMSHELRTPLNAILGFAQLMERDPSLTPRQRDFLATINRSGEHLLNLINDVLEVSKIEAGRTVFHPIAFDLHRLLQTLEEMFQIRAEAKKLALQFQFLPNLPRYIITDEGKLRQVLINLLGNAVKFTNKGHIILRVTHNSRSSEVTGVQNRYTSPFLYILCFEIEDTGIGIALEEIEYLFQPFVQTSSGRQTQEGTGLGLAISRQFVEMMGGNIHLSSSLGKGSTFYFEIEIQLADSSMIIVPSTDRRAIQIAPNQPKYRILVVDDRLENRDLVAQILNNVGLETLTAVNGEEAIAYWQTWQPHLIWMDMRMPVMDGYEATRRIRQLESQLPQPSHTIIIALTASAFDEQQSKTRAAGCDDFVGKPFRESEIFDKMSQHLEIQYLYAGQLNPQTPNPSHYPEQPIDLTVMSPEWISELHQAAKRVNAKMIIHLIQQISSEHQTIAATLTDYVDRFRFDLIVELTQSNNE